MHGKHDLENEISTGVSIQCVWSELLRFQSPPKHNTNVKLKITPFCESRLTFANARAAADRTSSLNRNVTAGMSAEAAAGTWGRKAPSSAPAYSNSSLQIGVGKQQINAARIAGIPKAGERRRRRVPC